MKIKTTTWYGRFRAAAYASAIGSLFWTVFLILPAPPFSYLLPIVAHGGPGTWFMLAYVLYLVIGMAGFGMLSNILYIIEVHEKRTLNQASVFGGFVLLNIGLVTSCVLLAIGGAIGGYALTIDNATTSSVGVILNSFVLPITATALTTVFGAALTLFSMIRAKAALS